MEIRKSKDVRNLYPNSYEEKNVARVPNGALCLSVPYGVPYVRDGRHMGYPGVVLLDENDNLQKRWDCSNVVVLLDDEDNKARWENPKEALINVSEQQFNKSKSKST